MTDELLLFVGSRTEAARWQNVGWSYIASSAKKVPNALERMLSGSTVLVVLTGAVGSKLLERWVSVERPLSPSRTRVLHYSRSIGSMESDLISQAFQHEFAAFVRQQPVMLQRSELCEVLAHENRGDFCIGGQVLSSIKAVTLVRGNLDVLTVPTKMFAKSGTGVSPDFGQFEVTDYGQTLKFGDYEASFDAVLYEADLCYRRRLKKQRLMSEKTFGAALRRLRKQRGLTRGDFSGISEKTLARIERGEVERPHERTLARIAKRLGVQPGEIEDY